MSTADEYFDWLIGLIDTGDPIKHFDMLRALFDTIFIPTVNNDQNRADDGLGLRFKYVDTLPFDPDGMPESPCSMLEMIIGLAFRMEDVLYDPEYGCQVPRWFWTMMNNLGLEFMDDGHFNRVKFDQIMDILIERRYGRDGFGSLFPMRCTTFDMKNTEIWYQMMYWINENY